MACVSILWFLKEAQDGHDKKYGHHRLAYIYICLYVCTGMYIYGYMHVQDEAKDAPNEGQDGHDKGEDDEDEAGEDQDQGQDGNVCVHVCIYIYVAIYRYVCIYMCLF